MREKHGVKVDRSAVVAEGVASVATVLSREFGPLTRVLRDRLSTEIYQLGDDERLIQLLGASIEGNVETILHMLQHGIDVERVEVPSAAVEYARRLAQNGIAVDALIRAYRLGQDSFLQSAFDELRGGDPELAAEVAQRIVGISFAYIDRVSQRVLGVYEDERERWLQNRSAIRAARIRELLDEDVVVVADAEEALGYRLMHQRHVGVVMWAAEQASRADRISGFERFARDLGERLDCTGRPLFVPSDETTGWAWLPLDRNAAEPMTARISSAVASSGLDINVAVGQPAANVDGFRRTHLQARQAQAVALIAGKKVASVTFFAEVGPIALLCSDLAATRSWVIDTLGKLAIGDQPHARMRETLRVFLSVGGSYTSAATELTLHKNSVQYRVRKAEEELGHPIRDGRMEIELALTACHWLGAAVLQPPA